MMQEFDIHLQKLSLKIEVPVEPHDKTAALHTSARVRRSTLAAAGSE